MKSLINQSIIACDKITDTPETVPINSINKKNKTNINGFNTIKYFSHYSISNHILIIVNDHCY